MDKVDISLSIVTYNNDKIIENTILSIINNIPDELKYKLYIIDNNSSDRTIEVVKKINGNIEIINLNVNNGFGFGHNAIISKLESNYHFVVNPDIIIEDKNQIDIIVNYMNQNQHIGMISPLILNPDLSIQYLCKTNPTVFDMVIRRISTKLFQKRQDNYVMKGSGYDKIMRIEYASGSFMVFRTSIYKNINGFDDKFFMYLEDADITRRVNEISTTIFFPFARVIHLWERGGHKKVKLMLITIQSMIIYFNKWGWKFY